MNSMQLHVLTFICAVTLSSAWPVRSQTNAPIPWDQIGARAGADFKGDGLAVTPIREGAKLQCVFQRLEGEATREGFWLTSTAEESRGERFRVVATRMGRLERGASERQSVERSLHAPHAPRSDAPRSDAPRLPDTGTVEVAGKLVRFIRPGLVEEYSVSMDGVRQDFVVLEKPRSRPLTPALIPVPKLFISEGSDPAKSLRPSW